MSGSGKLISIPEHFLNELIHYCSTNDKIEKVYLDQELEEIFLNSDIDLALYTTTNTTHSE